MTPETPPCSCTWFWNYGVAERRPEHHMEGICPLYVSVEEEGQ